MRKIDMITRPRWKFGCALVSGLCLMLLMSCFLMGAGIQRRAVKPPTIHLALGSVQIIAYGTQIVLRTIDTPDGPREYWRTFKVYATSYKPAALGGDDRTAIGMTLVKGIIGADPKLIPWRTNLYVPEYGLGIMADTGGARRSRYWIDLGYSDADYVGWHRTVDIYLLTPVPETIPYLLPPYSPP